MWAAFREHCHIHKHTLTHTFIACWKYLLAKETQNNTNDDEHQSEYDENQDHGGINRTSRRWWNMLGCYRNDNIVTFLQEGIFTAINLLTQSMEPSFLQTGSFSYLQMQRPSRHSVCDTASSHCSLKKQLSFTETAVGDRKVNLLENIHLSLRKLFLKLF